MNTSQAASPGASPKVDRRAAGTTPVTTADVHDAALTAFAARGYHGTSLKDIARSVGLRAPSLYNHISAKSDLLAEIILGTLTIVRAEFDTALTNHSAPVDQLREATYVYARRHATHRRETLVVNQDTQHLPQDSLEVAQAMRRAHEGRFRQLIVDGVEAGHFDVQSPKLASFAIREMCVSVARWFREDGELSAEDVAHSYATQALRMVGART